MYLTAREHYVAHLLLAKIYNDYKMWNAVTSFRGKNDEQERSFRFNSRLFEKAKLIAVQMGSGEGNSMWGRHHSEETKAKMRAYATGRKHSEETRRKISLAQKGKPKPWKEGRVVSEETRRKMSLALKGRKLTDEQKEKLRQRAKTRRKPVRRFALDGTFIDEFPCVKDIADILGITPTAVKMCCLGVNRTCHGYVLKYCEDCDNG